MNKAIPVIVLLLLTACSTAPRVVVQDGTLVGKFVKGSSVAAFLGVPFAEPPVGERRWQAPQPLASRGSRRDATAFAPACMQSMRILDWYRSMAVEYGGSADYYDDLMVSEDCLYLNVWTPTLKTDAKLPVMVWVHGGSNKSGWSYEPNYHGQKLAQRDVVVVSVAYRQGVFGFLSHPDLPADQPLANFGYWDLIASLRWIQDNIEAFGGDPERVTMFGESAGAQNIVALMVTEHTRGLLHRGIAQSTAGFGLNRMSTLAGEQQRALKLAAALALPDKGSLDALRAVPADELFAAYDALFPDYYHSPAIDDQLLHEPTWMSLQGHGFDGRQLIIGTNGDEWYASTAEDTSWEDVVRQSAVVVKGIDFDRALEIVREESDPRRALDRLRTASSMLCASQNLAAKVNSTGGGAWMYHFTRSPKGLNGVSLGAYHGVEYPYVFDTHDPYFAIDDNDRDLVSSMQNYWVRFAATGNPNDGKAITWPKFAAPNFPVQQFGNEESTIPAPEPELCTLFEQGLEHRVLH